MIDSLEVPRLALTDFGEEVNTPAGVMRMIFNEEFEDTGLGLSAAAIGQPVFSCLPEVAAELTEGDELQTVDGCSYRIFEITPQRADLTKLRVNQI